MRAGISVVMMTNDYARCRQVRRRNFGLFRRSGTDDWRRWRIEVTVGVDDRLGTKDAHAEDKKDDLHPSPESLGPGVAVTAPTGKRQRDHHQCNDGRLYHQAMPCLAAIRPAFSSVSINSHT